MLFSTAPNVPRSLVGDPLRLGQVLINLANNAIKFTEHGEIVVSAELVNLGEETAEIKFAVRDTGIGLTAEQTAQGYFRPSARRTPRPPGSTAGPGWDLPSASAWWK